MGIERRSYQPASSGSGNLADILERVLDKGIVIAGDIQVNLLDIELLTIKLRLLIASADTAREMGIDWWRNDPFLTGGDRDGRSEDGGQKLKEGSSGGHSIADRLERIETALEALGRPEGARQPRGEGDEH